MKKSRSGAIIFCVLGLLLFNGCSSGKEALEQFSGRRVQLFFATDRNDTGRAEPDSRFGSERDSLHYGTTVISFPADHRIGQLESALLADDALEHVLLKEVNSMSEERFFGLLTQSVNAYDKQELLVFVHGFNMSFAKASRRFGQIVSDLGYRGCPVYFSWPSRGAINRYAADKNCVEWSTLNLECFLEQLAVRSGSRKIILTAHSMGGRALTYAFSSLLQRRPDLADRFGALLLYAPDIDSGVFRRDIAPVLSASGVQVTLYVSGRDRALKVSRRLNGYERVGYVEDSPLIENGIETIDVGNVKAGFSGHSYYHQSRPVLSDMFYLINEGLSADERFSLEPVDTSDGRYWRFRR
ncbi:hypothetical protein CR161_09675 [Prosthecochloris sp. ZM]|uniref:alpha/beta hydrolase n=1 Tax=Prosthecochloris sp. ZM TaxID=2283143 RepID=UPI000DF80719|nr:alpha/beta fold hydrolase [Prosthecochloris sp. ZM]RDD30948.1 hypothetical protein CR161_09675 [Prosthecochloris sp. ZM]